MCTPYNNKSKLQPQSPFSLCEVDGSATVPGGCRIRRKITRAYLGLSQARAINAHCAVTVKNEVAVQGAEQTGWGRAIGMGMVEGGSSCPQVIPMLGNSKMICKRCANEIEFRLPIAGPSSYSSSLPSPPPTPPSITNSYKF